MHLFLLSFVPPLSLFSHFNEVKLLTYHLYQIPCIYIFLVLRLFWSLPGCSIILQVRRNRPLKTLSIDAPNYLKCVIFTYFHYTKRLSKYVLVCCNICNTEQITSHMLYVRLLKKCFCFQLYTSMVEKCFCYSAYLWKTKLLVICFVLFCFCWLSGCHSLPCFCFNTFLTSLVEKCYWLAPRKDSQQVAKVTSYFSILF
jgi:hypothetical protein